jgi:subtilisin family serine protease
VVKEYDSPIFSGARITADDYNLDQLTALPGVVRAWHNQELTLLNPVDKRQQPVPPANASQHDVHWATGVHELHDRGILGKGVKIGIIDTGVWYNHDALGSGGFGPGHKVAGGWDLVGNGWAPGSARNPDDDPADEQGHGTHVAGIIAGEATETGWKGVAPEASLYAYKVFGTSGSTDNSIVIEAFIQAYEDGMDIITASLGSASGFVNNPLALVANRIAAEGVVVTVAAGNSGSGGPFHASNGGAGDLTLSVASADVARTEESTTLQPSSFTSWGALYDLSVKPDIAAPG